MSIQPAAVDRVVRDQAQLVGVDPNRWCTDVLDLLIDWHPGLEWVERRPAMLVAAVGAFTHPRFTSLYAGGRRPLGEIPRWASPVLRKSRASDAVQCFMGRPANRRVIRSFAGALAASPGEVSFERFGLALAAAALVSDDVVANVLDAPLRASPGLSPLSVEEIQTIRTGLAWFPEARRADLLMDVVGNHTGAALAATLGRLAWVIDVAPRPLPARLARLEDLCSALVPVVGGPVATSPPGRGTAPREPDPAAAVPNGRARGAQPKIDGAAVGCPPVWAIPEALATVVDHRVGDLKLSVPTSVVELRMWSRELRNCLYEYGPAIAEERSWVIGILRGHKLLGAFEICPKNRRLRQAQGPFNQPLPESVYTSAVSALGDLGVLKIHRTT